MNERDTYKGRLAEYLAGRMPAGEASAFEDAIARDPKLAREAESLRPVVDQFATPDSADDFRLSPDRLAVIRAAASRQIVDFPGAKKPAPRRSRSGVAVFRRIVPAVAAAAAVVIGAFLGFNSGRESFNTGVQSWHVAARVEPVAPAMAVDDAVHYYPPAYGLDHYASWASYHRPAADFVISAPFDYGLPGPRPAYMIGSQIPFVL